MQTMKFSRYIFSFLRSARFLAPIAVIFLLVPPIVTAFADANKIDIENFTSFPVSAVVRYFSALPRQSMFLCSDDSFLLSPHDQTKPYGEGASHWDNTLETCKIKDITIRIDDPGATNGKLYWRRYCAGADLFEHNLIARTSNLRSFSDAFAIKVSPSDSRLALFRDRGYDSAGFVSEDEVKRCAEGDD
jgi:hypothetical protein